MIFLLVGAILGFLNISSILEAVDRIIVLIQTVAKGDLTHNISTKRKTELSAIIYAMSDLQNSLKTIISSISTASIRLTESANALTNNSTQISKGTVQAFQVSNSVATAVDELSATKAFPSRAAVRKWHSRPLKPKKLLLLVRKNCRHAHNHE